MNRSEAKFQNTANKMNKALFKLINEKPFQDISVSEIVPHSTLITKTLPNYYKKLIINI